jgi:hypothetical protein
LARARDLGAVEQVQAGSTAAGTREELAPEMEAERVRRDEQGAGAHQRIEQGPGTRMGARDRAWRDGQVKVA